MSHKSEYEIQLDPDIIYFTHAKIRGCFSTGKPISETFNEIKYGLTKITDIPIITVYCVDNKYYSLNNRRLYLFKMCKQNGLLPDNIINVIIREIPSKKILKRFITNNSSLIAKISFR
jgi:hypothetical protein